MPFVPTGIAWRVGEKSDEIKSVRPLARSLDDGSTSGFTRSIAFFMMRSGGMSRRGLVA